jgi:hypothetical protein
LIFWIYIIFNLATYLPPVTCPPGLVQDRTGKCGCASGFVLVNGKCEKPVTTTTTRKPEVRTVPVTTKATTKATTAAPYCDSGLVLKGKECVCPVSGQIYQNGKCVCPGQLSFINGKCGCAPPLIQKGNNCEAPVTTPKPAPKIVTTTTKPPCRST